MGNICWTKKSLFLYFFLFSFLFNYPWNATDSNLLVKVQQKAVANHARMLYIIFKEK